MYFQSVTSANPFDQSGHIIPTLSSELNECLENNDFFSFQAQNYDALVVKIGLTPIFFANILGIVSGVFYQPLEN